MGTKLRNWIYAIAFVVLASFVIYDTFIADNYDFENHSEIPKDNY